jgi:hypothetical protein
MTSTLSEFLISPLTVFYAPIGTTLPAQSLAYGAAWPVGWVKLGDQKEGGKLSYSYEKMEIKTQNSRGGTVAVRRNSETAMFETVLAGWNKDNLILTLAGKSVNYTAATTSVNGTARVSVGGALCLPSYMWGFEGEVIDDECQESYYARAFFHKGIVDSGFEAEFKFDDYVGLPLKIQALSDTAKASNEQLLYIDLEIPATLD